MQIEGSTSSIQGTGLKYDTGKVRLSLLMRGMAKTLIGVARVLTFGAEKYEAHSWQTVPNGKERYTDALYRHLLAYESGEELDKESGLHHLHHALCNLLFITELTEREKNNVQNTIG